MEKKPVLSIGMIFKNEARCLRRCLESLKPLREALPCELIMADTGSTDGSRETAAEYADILFDFPWVDDFSAARNAVMDRASGVWFFTVDADEWLDGDLSELTAYLTKRGGWPEEVCTVIQRNYDAYDADSSYADISALRLVKMSTGFRYHGAIHESWAPEERKTPLVTKFFSRTILHHDGYADSLGKAGLEKRGRNIRLLRRELEKTPDSLFRLLQYVESGRLEEDFLDRLRRAVELVGERKEGWRKFGPPIYAQAVKAAVERDLPELESWLEQMEDLFPESYFTRLDAAYFAFVNCWSRKRDYAGCVRWGEAYLAGLAAYEADEDRAEASIHGVIAKAAPADGEEVRIFLAVAHIKEGETARALELLGQAEASWLDGRLTESLVQALLNLQAESPLDTAPVTKALWAGLTAPAPSRARAEERKAAFLRSGYKAFLPEADGAGALRPSYTLFLPLADRCDLGRAAAVLAAESAPEMEELLARVEDWETLPPLALEKALLSGVCFPLAERPLKLEEMDALALGLTQDPGTLYRLLNKETEEDFAGSWQTLSWTRALALAAVRTFGWKDGGREGMALARTFAKVEGAFLTGCYAPEVLREGNLLALPPMHRFGWYCAQAFNALEAGDSAGYTRLLRAGLETHPAMKPMVEYLAEHTPELGDAGTSPELLALAEKVRIMLAAYPEGDPAVAALKASPAYQRVAYLLEGDRG